MNSRHYLKHFLHQVSFDSQQILRERFYYDPHFVERQTEAQRDAELCVRPSQKHWKEQDLFFFRFSLCISPACLWGPFPPHVCGEVFSTFILPSPALPSSLSQTSDVWGWSTRMTHCSLFFPLCVLDSCLKSWG